MANNLKRQFEEYLGVPTTVYGRQFTKADRDALGIHEYPLIFLASLHHRPYTHEPPPHKYFLYQLEQLNLRDTYEKNIVPVTRLIQRSIMTFDYSQTNMSYYGDDIKHKIRYLPPPPMKVYMPPDDPIYDVLFFGVLSPRRKKILKYLSDGRRSVHAVERVVGADLTRLIRKARVVLNLHNGPDAILETPRIHEAVHIGVRIVSERPSPEDWKKVSGRLKARVRFVEEIHKDLSNIGLLVAALAEPSTRESPATIDKYLDETLACIRTSLKPVQYMKYPCLFHKYLLGITNPDAPVTYNTQLEKGSLQERRHIAHLHCFDLSKFGEIFAEYIGNMNDEFGIVVTYSIGKLDMIGSTSNVTDMSVLEVENRGMDIGGKLCAITYLSRKKSEYTHILFLHSKSDEYLRRRLFDPLIGKGHLSRLKMNMDGCDGVFPDCRSTGDHGRGVWWINHDYVTQLSDYLGIEQGAQFIFGNICVLSRRAINKVFGQTTTMYNMLNTATTFDYNWFKLWYAKNQGTAYNGDSTVNYPKLISSWIKCTRERLIPNNTTLSDKYRKHGGKYTHYPYQLRDGMIEHAFERLYINAIRSLKGTYRVMPSSGPLLAPRDKWYLGQVRPRTDGTDHTRSWGSALLM
jgi:hypothetical protein